MTTQVSGDTGVSQCQPNSVSQDDLQSGVAGKGPAFQVGASVWTNLPTAGQWGTLTFDVEAFDTANCFANNRFTPNVAGYYQINLSYAGRVGANTNTSAIAIAKNGSPIKYQSRLPDNTPQSNILSCSWLVYLNGTTDYVCAMGVLGTAGGDMGIDTGANTFSGALVRAA